MITEQVSKGTIMTWKFTNGSRVIIADKDVAHDFYSWRLYVNHGETATLTHGKAKTESGMRKQITAKLSTW